MGPRDGHVAVIDGAGSAVSVAANDSRLHVQWQGFFDTDSGNLNDRDSDNVCETLDVCPDDPDHDADKDASHVENGDTTALTWRRPCSGMRVTMVSLPLAPHQ